MSDKEIKVRKYRGGPVKEKPAVHQRSAFYSVGVHAAVLMFVWAGLPDFMDTMPPEPVVMTVDVVPITDHSNIPINTTKKLAKNDTPPPPAKKTVEPVKSKSTPPPAPKEPEKVEKTPEKPIEEPAEKLPEPPKPDKPKPPEPEKPKEPEKEPKKDEKDELEDILQDVRKAATESDEKTPPKKTSEPTGAKTVSDRFDPNAQISISQMDAIKQQLTKCWVPPAGVKDDYTLIVVVRAKFNTDGTVIGQPEVTGGNRSNPAFGAASNAAVRAINKCAPLKNLPMDKYAAWKDMEVTFDPKFLY